MMTQTLVRADGCLEAHVLTWAPNMCMHVYLRVNIQKVQRKYASKFADDWCWNWTRSCGWRVYKQCTDSFLSINVSKTKDVLVDFRKSYSGSLTAIVQDKEVEIITEEKYLGSITDNKLGSTLWQQLLFFLLNCFIHFLHWICSYFVLVWFVFLTLPGKDRLSNFVQMASTVIGIEQSLLQDMHFKRAIRKDPTRP